MCSCIQLQTSPDPTLNSSPGSSSSGAPGALCTPGTVRESSNKSERQIKIYFVILNSNYYSRKEKRGIFFFFSRQFLIARNWQHSQIQALHLTALLIHSPAKANFGKEQEDIPASSEMNRICHVATNRTGRFFCLVWGFGLVGFSLIFFFTKLLISFITIVARIQHSSKIPLW